jgi:hypothetical protein
MCKYSVKFAIYTILSKIITIMPHKSFTFVTDLLKFPKENYDI